MDRIEGLEKVFSKSSIILLTTFDGNDEKTRQMTNFNKDPYKTMWFPTEKSTNKVREIEKNEKVILTLPSDNEGMFYEIEGKAYFADQREIDERWRWWWLYWHPTQKKRFPFNPIERPRRVIIKVDPIKARLISKS